MYIIQTLQTIRNWIGVSGKEQKKINTRQKCLKKFIQSEGANNWKMNTTWQGFFPDFLLGPFLQTRLSLAEQLGVWGGCLPPPPPPPPPPYPAGSGFWAEGKPLRANERSFHVAAVQIHGRNIKFSTGKTSLTSFVLCAWVNACHCW
jgi:hypothetical protein